MLDRYLHMSTDSVHSASIEFDSEAPQTPTNPGILRRVEPRKIEHK